MKDRRSREPPATPRQFQRKQIVRVDSAAVFVLRQRVTLEAVNMNSSGRLIRTNDLTKETNIDKRILIFKGSS